MSVVSFVTIFSVSKNFSGPEYNVNTSKTEAVVMWKQCYGKEYAALSVTFFSYTLCTTLCFLEFMWQWTSLYKGELDYAQQNISRNLGSTARRMRKERKGGWKYVLFVINTCDVHCAVFWYEEIKVVVVSNWATRHEEVLGSGGLASRILNGCTWMRRMLGSAPWPLYNRLPPQPVMEPRGTHYGRRKGGRRKRSRPSGGISCPCLEINSETLASSP
jgi:hypothetical protein